MRIKHLTTIAVLATAAATATGTTDGVARFAGDDYGTSAKTAQSIERQVLSAEKGTYVLGSRPSTSGLRNTAPAAKLGAPVAGMPTLWGSVIYNDRFEDRSATYGLYELPRQAGSTTCLFRGPDANAGGVLVGDIYYSTTTYSLMGNTYIQVEGYNINTGAEVCSYETTDYSAIACGGLAVDPKSGTVYGLTYTPELDGYQLSKLEYTTRNVKVTRVAYLSGNWNSLAFDSEGQMYGISFAGYGSDEEFEVIASYLNKIDKNTGAVTQIGATGVAPQYFSSAVIDPATNRMFWNVCPADMGGYMYEVNLETGFASYLYRLEDNDEVMGMLIAPPEAEPTAPAVCENVQVNFVGTSLTGTVTLKTPTLLYDGQTAGSGKLSVTVLANGVQVAKVDNKSWGENLSIPVDLTSTGSGMYTFTVYATGNGGDGAKTHVKNVWVGADAPEATTATLTYTNGYMVVSWLPVTGTVNGGFLDLADLTYVVKRHDGSIAMSGQNTTSFLEKVDAPEAKTEFYYTVEAVCNGMTSAAAVTNSIILGNLVPPCAFNFKKDGLTDWTIIDSNRDDKTWLLDGNSVSIAYNIGRKMDDWLITPAILLKGGKSYTVRFDSWCFAASKPERIEVMYGTAPTVSGQTGTVVEPTIIDSENAQSYSGVIKPTEDGLYYIGFHGISDADQFRLYLSNITVEAGVTDAAPAAATDLHATAAADGTLNATISLKAPDKTVNGSSLSSLTKIEVLRSGNVVHTFDNPTPGATLTCTDSPDRGGDVTWTVIAYNEAGAGPLATVSTFVGCHLPLAPAQADMTRTAVTGEVQVTWTPVTTDVLGNTLPAGAVTYDICAYVVDEWIPVVESVSATSCTFQAVAAGEQMFSQFGIRAVTTGGAGKVTVTPCIPVGTPYNGLEESFENAELHYEWGLESILDGDAVLFTDNSFSDVKSQDGDNGFIGFVGGVDGTGAALYTGLVSLDNMTDPTFSFYVYNNDGQDLDEVYVSVLPVGETTWVPLLSSSITNLCHDKNGWHRVDVSLASYGNRVVQVRLAAITRNYSYKMFDNLRIGSFIPENGLPVVNDLAGVYADGVVKLTWSNPASDRNDVELAGYNMYRNGIRLNGELLTDTSYTDSNVVAGVVYLYNVTAAYNGKGESTFSNTVRIDTSGVQGFEADGIRIASREGHIVITGADGQQVQIVNTAGGVIYSHTAEGDVTVSVQSGVYAVRAGAMTVKLVVR